MRILFVVLDAFPHDMVDPDLTPVVSALAAEGHRSSAGGEAHLLAATYPNMASFVTGVAPADHGIFANRVWTGDRFRPARRVGPAAPTVFDHVRARGLDCAVAVGDHELVGVCGAEGIERHFPPGGVAEAAAAKGPTGYGVDADVVAAALALDMPSAAFSFVQLDEVDAVRHVHGASSDSARGQVTRTDAALGELVEMYRPVWDDTVVVVVSDHDHEDVIGADPTVEQDLVGRGLTVETEGTAALVIGDTSVSDLVEVAGVEGAAHLGGDHFAVWGPPGVVLGLDWGQRGDHASIRTRTQLAVVAGGHPAAARLGEQIVDSRPSPDWWARPLLDLLP